MRCPTCKAADVALDPVTAPYDSLLPAVIVDGLEAGTCPRCGATTTGVPRPLELDTIILTALLGKPARLAPAEVRFLRGLLGLHAKELAAVLGVTPENVSRWETGASPISALGDRCLRLLTALKRALTAPDLTRIQANDTGPLALRIALVGTGRARRWRVATDPVGTRVA